MFPSVLTLALLSASTISAAPVRASPFTTEPTKVTVMATSTASLQARQWEWTPSATAWSELAWTQPAWSSPMSYSQAEQSIPTPISTSSWIDRHHQNPGAFKTGWITGLSILGLMVGLGLILFLYTYIRKYCHKRACRSAPHNASDVEVNAGLQRNSQAPAFSTPPGPADSPITEPPSCYHPTRDQSLDLADTPRLTEPHNDLTRIPRRLSSRYKNNIPFQETHWPLGETEQNTARTCGE
jgi:hypothetical protein